MKSSILNAKHRLSRRSFLAGAGVAVSLPLLDAMVPAFNRAADAPAGRVPRRMVAIQTNLGILPQFWTPQGAGMDYRPSPYLEVLRDFRRDMTVFSGVSHPGVDGGHSAEKSFLTAAPHPGAGTFRNTVSLDQVAAERIGNLTRIPALVTHVGVAGRSLSYTRSGVEIPAERSVAVLFRRMFVQGSASEVNARLHDLQRGRSVLDFVNQSAHPALPAPSTRPTPHSSRRWWTDSSREAVRKSRGPPPCCPMPVSFIRAALPRTSSSV